MHAPTHAHAPRTPKTRWRLWRVMIPPSENSSADPKFNHLELPVLQSVSLNALPSVRKRDDFCRIQYMPPKRSRPSRISLKIIEAEEKAAKNAQIQCLKEQVEFLELERRLAGLS